MDGYWFFLSYARRDSEGAPSLKRFCKDLALEVGRTAGLESSAKTTEIGFFDEAGIDVGANWSHTLAEALQTSRVFVCLYSPAYFKSEYCGKEFQVFLSRVEAYAQTSRLSPPRLIMPVLWSGLRRLPNSLPAAVAQIQYTHAEFGEKYINEGLHYIMRMQEETEYQYFITRFADNLVTQAEMHRLPALPRLPHIDEINSAFQTSPPQQPVLTPQPHEPAQTGSQAGPGGESKKPGLSAFKRRQLEQERNTLMEEWNLRTEKDKRLRVELAIESHPASKFQLEQVIKFEQEKLQELARRLEEIEQALG
jgi:hypothetical protein